VKAALRHNAAAIIFTHNHPSGIAEPSEADELITIQLKEALTSVDIRVVDHLIVGGTTVESFAERGLLQPHHQPNRLVVFILSATRVIQSRSTRYNMGHGGSLIDQKTGIELDNLERPNHTCSETLHIEPCE